MYKSYKNDKRMKKTVEEDNQWLVICACFSQETMEEE